MTTTTSIINVELPALGEAVTEATITRWLKAVGDEVQYDEPLLEPSTRARCERSAERVLVRSGSRYGEEPSQLVASTGVERKQQKPRYADSLAQQLEPTLDRGGQTAGHDELQQGT